MTDPDIPGLWNLTGAQPGEIGKAQIVPHMFDRDGTPYTAIAMFEPDGTYVPGAMQAYTVEGAARWLKANGFHPATAEELAVEAFPTAAEAVGRPPLPEMQTRPSLRPQQAQAQARTKP